MTADVIIEREGAVGRVRLNRPAAIHALNQAMCEAISAALLEWRDDEGVTTVILDHAEGRGFCAGGDVVMLARSGVSDATEARAFFFAEYRLNHLLFTYPKPVMALMDGITMGGGVGLALPCSYRVATERTRLAMPETGIGLFPDVGGGRYLSRLPGRVGQFMALTGARLDGSECLHLGLATHYCESEALPTVIERIKAAPESIDEILVGVSTPPPQGRIASNQAAIDRLFAADTLEGVIAALDADGGEWAAKERATLATKSPLSCKVSLRLLREGAQRDDFADEMRAEYALACHIVRTHDFAEGVRALLIDKTNDPDWQPSNAEAVGDGLLDELFAPLPNAAAWTPFPDDARTIDG